MKVGISTACFHGKSEVEQSLLRLYPTGAKNIEIFLECFSEYEPDYVRELDRLCKQFGFAVSAVHPLTTQFEPQIFGPPCRQQREAMDIFQKVLAAAKILGAPLYNLHGPVMIKKSVDSGAETEGAARAIAKLGGRLLPRADYTIPGTEVVHRVVVVEKIAPTPKGYPRRWAKMQKAPL